MNRNYVFLAAVVVAMGAAPRAASAAESDHQNLAAGDALHNEATILLNDNKLEAASQKYGEAFAKSQNPSSLYAQALVEKKLGHWKRALKLFQTYVALPANVKVPPTWKAKAEAEVAACEKQVCRIDVRADSFMVDGAAATGMVSVEPGAHSVKMSGKSGDKTEAVTCAAGEVVTVVYEKPTSTPPVEQERGGSWLVPAVLGGVGVVGLAVGMGFGAASGSSKDELRALQDQRRCGVDLPACESVRSSGSTQAAVSVVGYVAGGTALVAAVVSALVIAPWKKEGATSAGMWSPSFGPDGAGLSYSKRF